MHRVNPFGKRRIFFLCGLLALGLAVGQPATSAEGFTRISSVRGRVVSSYGPVEDARVRVSGSETVVLTDSLGGFELEAAHFIGLTPRITAGKEGWFNNGRYVSAGRGTEIALYPVPRADNPDYVFVPPIQCAQCHTKVTQYYDRTKMAHTTSNPLVMQYYYGTDALNRPGHGPGYKLDFPGSGGDCISCHAPSIAAATPPSRDMQDALNSPRSEWDGISCDYCHKIQRVVADDSTPSRFRADQVRLRGRSYLEFGPYDDVAVPPMAASYNPLFDSGRLCAVCHSHIQPLAKGKTWDHSKVYSDAEWKGFGLTGHAVIPVQTTYQEWKMWQSGLSAKDPNKGKKCQDCHLSWRKDMLPYDNYIVDNQARQMWGANRSPKTIHPHQFDGGTETQLKTAMALEIEGKVEGKIFTIKVHVTNTDAGHWIPTGETMRSVMLIVRATGENGKPLKLIKGERLPDWAGVGNPLVGNDAGLPGSVFGRVLTDAKGTPNVPFWRATAVVSDTRVRPKSTVTKVYQFALNSPDEEPNAEAGLVYRPVFRPLAKSKNWLIDDITIAKKAW
jgi:hypothetical protein